LSTRKLRLSASARATATGEERFVEIEHPEAAFERIRQGYRDRGYDERWIEERMRADLIRNDLTTDTNTT
jgi:hypothetical protein